MSELAEAHHDGCLAVDNCAFGRAASSWTPFPLPLPARRAQQPAAVGVTRDPRGMTGLLRQISNYRQVRFFDPPRLVCATSSDDFTASGPLVDPTKIVITMYSSAGGFLIRFDDAGVPLFGTHD